jgi:hypothetical protein
MLGSGVLRDPNDLHYVGELILPTLTLASLGVP